VEYQQTFVQPPKASTLRRLRGEAPADFAFVIRAWQLITHEPGAAGYRGLQGELDGPPQSHGLLQSTPQVQQAWEATRRAAEALDARGVVFETPASFTPTVVHRQRLSAFFETLERDGRLMVWAPGGLWSTAELLQICKDLQLVPCWDPLLEGSYPPGEVAYLRPRGMISSSGRPLAEHQLLALSDGLQGYSTAFCIFNTPASFADATRLERLF
jgi:uncharacterized protein YecE (DUF72 family)